MPGYTEGVTASTTWAWKQVKLEPAARPPRTAARRASTLPLPVRRNPREAITVTMHLRGGSECWVELKAHGRTVRTIGSTAIYDVLMRLCNADIHTPLSERRDWDGNPT